MQTNLEHNFLLSAKGQLADKILRSCVHCGFCTATCPTYQILGDELDGPRGRIYQIKQMLEGQPVTKATLSHLDRCLACRACETTCPSGVEYSHLLEIGRSEAEKRVKRPWSQTLLRKTLLAILPFSARFDSLLKVARLFRPVLPYSLKKKIPEKIALSKLTLKNHSKKMLILDGCVQPSLSPEINHAARQVLDAIDIEPVSFSGCCGAINQHLSDEDNALILIKNNIDRLITEFDNGIDGIVMTATGCGAMFKEYPFLLQYDDAYKDKAEQVASKTFDLSEVIDTKVLKTKLDLTKDCIAVHTPCTLQHAQKQPSSIENILTACGYQLSVIKDKHLCCGSAGTYSITQPKLSQQLLQQRLTGLMVDSPDLIVTANIGCLLHLNSESTVPVKHWIEIISDNLKP
ncbi:MAG: glycolate oxidase subunit GlcF [Gammaproteobacteria bacterium]|nr:glycolate oxidase subunit GlcF [Gammaproteobacteria bacterium]MCW8987626.1 glycolate oxidase subunit GlcF [Gammaproteobacteria bacterium]